MGLSQRSPIMLELILSYLFDLPRGGGGWA